MYRRINLFIALKCSALRRLSLKTLSMLIVWLYSISISLSGDGETNPGLKQNSTETFSFCGWNLNSISFHNYNSKKNLSRLNRVLRLIDLQ